MATNEEITELWREGRESHPNVSAVWDERQDRWLLKEWTEGRQPSAASKAAKDLFEKAARESIRALGDSIAGPAPSHLWLERMHLNKRGLDPFWREKRLPTFDEARDNQRTFDEALRLARGKQRVFRQLLNRRRINDDVDRFYDQQPMITNVFAESAKYWEDCKPDSPVIEKKGKGRPPKDSRAEIADKLIGGNIARLRSERGITQEDLAGMGEINIDTLRGHEQMKNSPVGYLSKYCRALGCTLDELLAGVVEPHRTRIKSRIENQAI